MKTLKVTTWNVQNLFRPPSADKAATALYALKLKELARVVRELAPDVLALQEVGGEDALVDLQRAIGPTELDHRAIGVPDARGICCAFLSRSRFEVLPRHVVELPETVLGLGLREIDQQPMTRLGRGALHVRVERADFSLDLINVHLKSKLLTFPGGKFSTTDEDLRARVAAQALARRAAEAAAVRAVVSKLRAEQRPVIVLGDLNDVPSAATTQILLGPGGSAIETRGFALPDVGDAQRLWNLSALVAEERRFSRVHNGHREMLDQILVSEELARSGRWLCSVDARIEGLRSIGDDPGADVGATRPDHAAVTLSLKAA